MEKLIVNGGRPLSGEISVSGSKNAALPILFSTILMHGISVIENLPDIGDISVALDILVSLGAQVRRDNDAVYIDTRTLSYTPPPATLVSKIRASTYLIGACLSRFGEARLGNFGGCNFSRRPIDLHLLACERLGASVRGERITADRLFGGVIDFPVCSVGATVNAILLAASAEGETVIRGFAREPHVMSLVAFLNSAGASVTVYKREIRIIGKRLSGGKIKIIGDMIEAGSYLAAGLVTRGEVTVRGIDPDSMTSLTSSFSLLGARLSVGENYISVSSPKVSFPVRICAEPYPGFPTDLQPIMAPTLAVYSGGILRDTVWRSRFGYLAELERFGIAAVPVGEGYIIKKSRIRAATVTAPDLRGGMACVLAALAASGESVVLSAKTLLRGYENLVDKLSALGADVSGEP